MKLYLVLILFEFASAASLAQPPDTHTSQLGAVLHEPGQLPSYRAYVPTYQIHLPTYQLSQQQRAEPRLQVSLYSRLPGKGS